MSTIAAISTPNAAGGIGIVRLSGEEAIAISEKCFRAYSGKPVSGMKGYTAAYGEVFDADGPVDEAVLLVYRAPKSYTGEDVAEICCHGGLPAEAGEFTKRAFLNGKMDLAQAESVMNVIAAQGSAALNAARNTLQGSVSRKIGAVAASLVTAAAGLAAWADYPDEDIPEVENGALLRTVADAEGELNRLIARYDSGKAVTQGVNTVICGKPNVGKSTLMNLLSGYSRSIVTGVAGTTRDVVEETVRVGDLLLRLADTAGLRDTEDEVERIGVSIAKERIDAADLVLAVFDSSRPLTEEDNSLIEQCRGKRCVAVVNKSDLPPAFDGYRIGFEGRMILKNEAYTPLQITKVNKSGKPLKGAVFDLYEADPESDKLIPFTSVKGNLISEGNETDSKGQIIFPNWVDPGDYYLIETTAPGGGYLAWDEAIHFRYDGHVTFLFDNKFYITQKKSPGGLAPYEVEITDYVPEVKVEKKADTA